MTIQTPNSQMIDWLEKSDLARTLIGGTVSMRAAGEKYSTRGERESVASFERRISRMILKNMYKKTCQHLVGQVFQKELFISPDMPEEITSLLDNIDCHGSNIHLFASQVFFHGLSAGVGGIHINTTSTDQPIHSREDAVSNGVRPYFRLVKGEDIVGFNVDSLGLGLTQLRLLGVVHVDEGLYDQEQVPSVLLYDEEGWQLFSRGGSDFEVVETGTYSSASIPFTSFTPGDQLSLVTSTPPMDDMAYLQLGHWGSFNDQSYILHTARVPILFSRFAKLRELTVDVAVLFDSDETESELKWVELTGGCIPFGREDVKDWEESISLYGLQQLAPRTNNATATEKRLAASESSSTLANWVIEFESMLQTTFEILGEMLGVVVPLRCCELNKEFDFKVADSQLLLSILQAERQKVLSKGVASREFVRRGAVSGVETSETNESELEAESEADLEFLESEEEIKNADI